MFRSLPNSFKVGDLAERQLDRRSRPKIEHQDLDWSTFIPEMPEKFARPGDDLDRLPTVLSTVVLTSRARLRGLLRPEETPRPPRLRGRGVSPLPTIWVTPSVWRTSLQVAVVEVHVHQNVPGTGADRREPSAVLDLADDDARRGC